MSEPAAAVELRDSALARTYLVQGMWLARLMPPTVESLGNSLQLVSEMLAVGDPLPPLGLIMDVGHLVLDTAGHIEHPLPSGQPGLPGEVIQRYEDYVLGKLYADGGFERGAAAVCRYTGQDRLRGTAWLIGRFAERAGLGGVHISPNVVRVLQNAPREEVLAEGAQSLRADGLLPLLEQSYVHLVDRVRQLGDVLGIEDVFELEHGTVLVEFGQRLALRQMLQQAARLESAVPLKPLQLASRHRNVPTHLLDEDTYPVGGFSSISNTGTIESLLHSQLAYMEPDTEQRPDLFDIKFLRGELLYYARDENEFLRRRRTILMLLAPDLVEARIKDAELPCQRIIMLLAAILAVVRRLRHWLSDEALQIEILVTSTDEQILSDERELLQMALDDQITGGVLRVGIIEPSSLGSHIATAWRRSLTSVVDIGLRNVASHQNRLADIHLHVSRPHPALSIENEPVPGGDNTAESWQSAVTQLMNALARGT